MAKIRIIAIDIDGVLCPDGIDTGLIPDGFKTSKSYQDYYRSAVPIKKNIVAVNRLFNQGHRIVLFTSRLEEDRQVTEEWLKKNGVKYTEIILGKPRYDAFVDDRGRRLEEVIEEYLEDE